MAPDGELPTIVAISFSNSDDSLFEPALHRGELVPSAPLERRKLRTVLGDGASKLGLLRLAASQAGLQEPGCRWYRSWISVMTICARRVSSLVWAHSFLSTVSCAAGPVAAPIAKTIPATDSSFMVVRLMRTSSLHTVITREAQIRSSFSTVRSFRTFPVLSVEAGSNRSTSTSSSATGRLLDAARNDEKLSGAKLDGPVAELHAERAADDEEQLVLAIVVVPDERAEELDEFDLLSVQIGGDSRLPVLVDLARTHRPD